MFGASFLEGAPLKEYFRGDPIKVVLESGEKNLVYDAVVERLAPPDRLFFRMVGSPSESAGREHVRIDDLLCLEYFVTRGAEQELIERFRARNPRKPPVQISAPAWFTQKDERSVLEEVEKEILKSLSSMDHKIDAIVKYLLDGNRNALMALSPRRVNISGSGIRFLVTDPVSVGDFLEMRLYLPDSGGVPVNILGEVVRAESGRGNGTEVAVRYRFLEEEDRDRIIRYIFGRQREALRRNQEHRGERNVL
ncbi:MAG: hypothetical protein Kow00128_00420 [Deltaproteobacteria bacterium]